MRDDFVDRMDEDIKRKPRRREQPPLRRKPRGKQPPFNTQRTAVKLVGKTQQRQTIIISGGPPKKLTSGLRKHLRKVHAQNKAEAERQLAMLGLELSALGLEKPPRTRKR